MKAKTELIMWFLTVVVFICAIVFVFLSLDAFVKAV